MSIKLTDTQRAILRAAALREDRCLPPAQSLRRAQIRKTAEKLIEAGFVREVKAKPSSPAWLHDDQLGSAFALKLTAAGMKAIATEESGPQRPLVPKDPVASANPKTLQDRSTSSPDTHEAQGQMTGHPTAPGNAKDEPRSSSKIAAVIGMLGRDLGATIDELMRTTGWLHHTTRAALTGLRKRGYGLAVDRSDRERGSVYRIEAKPGEPKPNEAKADEAKPGDAKSGAGEGVAEAA